MPLAENNKQIISYPSYVKYFAYGYISGMAGIIASHPFDTVKTCIQDKKLIPRTLSGLYRGILPPLFGVGLEKAIVFGTFQNTIDYTQSNAISGALAGLTASIVVTPVERIKILLQTGSGSNIRFAELAKMSSLFKGLGATWTREIPGFAIYFSVFNELKGKTMKMTPYHSFGYGMCAGATAWIFIYPQDRIKTYLQSKIDPELKISYKSAIQNILRDGGITKLYRGFSFALMRAVPLHATTFTVMEHLLSCKI
jgi:solute carrier family 25 carnitine/acylcarnitine transporter 20/29